MVHEAFKQNELVRIDCKGIEKIDYKKIGAKLRDMVPCILVTFDHEQIVITGKKTCFQKREEVFKTLVPYLDKTISFILMDKFHLMSLEYFSKKILEDCRMSYSIDVIKFNGTKCQDIMPITFN